MTNQEAKQEAIKKAYGEHWEKVSEFCDSDGWITNKWVAHGVSVGIDYEDAGFSFEQISCKQFNSSDNTWRLKSIYSILNNNGWIRIEPDGSNLPIDDVLYDAFMNTGSIIKSLTKKPIVFWFKNKSKEFASHYKPTTPELPPIY